MNFYKHHLGDYDGATVHLSWDEDHAYTRLIRIYYRLEKPIPLLPAETYRLVRATTRAQKSAVTRVLHEFFQEMEDGWHNARCDEEIAAYQAQAETNRRIARERTVERNGDGTDTDRSTNRGPSHKPEPRTRSQKPQARPSDTSLRSESSADKNLPDAAKSRAAAEERAERTRPTWKAYKAAYSQRYPGVEPTQDKQSNSLMVQFVEKVGVEDAPAIAEFFVGHNRGLYVSAKHDITLLARDGRGLRTEWLTGRKVTDTEARQADQTASRGEQAQRLMQKHGVAR